MTTFDQIAPILSEIFTKYKTAIDQLSPIWVNRDLNGRVRLIMDERLRDQAEAQAILQQIASQMAERLGRHAFPPERAVLFEPDSELKRITLPSFPLDGLPDVRVIDRLVTESDWAKIAPPATGAPRIVFFSIKGGVGRSTALAATAWALAQRGKRILALDLDLEAPGISAALLPDERRPKHGITDWLVEDLVDNGDEVFEHLVATSPLSLSADGDIYVVPAYGSDPGEYIAKLGRVWMPKITLDSQREGWSQRLRRFLDTLEQRLRPDLILIDARAGIDEIASACVTDLGATLVLLFAINSSQTWAGYQILFRHWRRTAVAGQIRERLQLVGAMIPEEEPPRYIRQLREHAWDVFREELYDEVPPGTTTAELWSFDVADEDAPHAPWPVRWNRGWASIQSLQGRLNEVGYSEVQYIFGPLIDGIRKNIDSGTTQRYD